MMEVLAQESKRARVGTPEPGGRPRLKEVPPASSTRCKERDVWESINQWEKAVGDARRVGEGWVDVVQRSGPAEGEKLWSRKDEGVTGQY